VGCNGITPFIVNVDIRRRCVVRFTLSPPLTSEKEPQSLSGEEVGYMTAAWPATEPLFLKDCYTKYFLSFVF
jgi:hypothetical protein